MTASSIATIPGLQPLVQLGAFTSGIPVPGSLWDAATWDSPAAVWEGGQGYIDPPWLDITCDVNAVEINTGRDRSIDRWQVGNATLTLNNATGWADVLPWSDDSLAFQVRPGRQIRFGVAVDGAAPRWLYRWFIDSVDPAYEPTQEADLVTVACVDAKGQVGKIAVAETAAPVGFGDTPNVRINRVLDAVSWAPGARDIVPSGVALHQTSFGSQVVDLIDRAADSAGGVTYGDSIGRIAYREIDWQNWPYDAGVDATIGNGFIYPIPGWLTPKIGQARSSPVDLTGMSAVTITAKVRKTDLTTAVLSTIAAVMGPVGAGPLSWRFGFDHLNGLGWGWSTTGSNFTDVTEILTAAQIAAAFDSNVDFHIGLQVNFAADTLQAITSTDGVTWTPLGSPKSAAIPPPFNAATPLEIGAQHVGTHHIWDGRIYWVEMRTGLDPSTDQDHAYLTPTVGTVTTPDPGLPPSTFTLIVKMRHPGGGGPYEGIVGQWSSTTAQRAWTLYRDNTTGAWNLWYYTTGGVSNELPSLNGGSQAERDANTPINTDVFVAIAIDRTTNRLNTYRSLDGVTWTTMVVNRPLPTVTIRDVAGAMTLGAIQGDAASTWTGRLYSTEMRSGLDPTGGTVLWRFDADEYPGTGTAYTDSRGRTWTSTNPNAFSGRRLWRFDANDYPGFGVSSYTDPRGRPWTVTGHGAITLGTEPNVTADVCPVGWELSFDLTDIATQVHAGRQGQPPQIFDDTLNQIRYGVETFTRTDLESYYDAHITVIGQQLLKALSADFMPNVAAVTIDAATSVPARDLCVTVDPTAPSRYHCRLHRSNGRVVFDREFLAVGVQHRIDPTGWETRIALDDAAPYMIPGPLLSAEWDSAHWDEEAWH